MNRTVMDKKYIRGYQKTRERVKRKYLCMAPFSSLFLDYKGNVFACFANKHLLLGKYDTQSIMEIWNSTPLQTLRNSLKNNSFENGCQLCKNKILQQQYTQVYARRYDYLTPSTHGFPTSIEVQLSNQCNLNCIMCVVSKDNPSQINIPAFRGYLKPIIPYLKYASFSGGEPFFINDYFDIWEDIYSLNKNCIISVNTNATILNEKVKAILNKLSFNITVSIDGFTKDTFERIRQHANRDLVYENLDYFAQYTKHKNTFFNVKMCMLNQNIYEFPSLFDYFTKKDIPIILNEVIYPLSTALWNNKVTKLREIIHFLSEHTPLFLKNRAGFHNASVWNELISLLTDYEKSAMYFENLILKNNGSLSKLNDAVIERISPFFTDSNELSFFLSVITKQHYQEQEQRKIYAFLLTVPFERLIGELEVRQENEVRQIFDSVIHDLIGQ